MSWPNGVYPVKSNKFEAEILATRDIYLIGTVKEKASGKLLPAIWYLSDGLCLTDAKWHLEVPKLDKDAVAAECLETFNGIIKRQGASQTLTAMRGAIETFKTLKREGKVKDE